MRGVLGDSPLPKGLVKLNRHSTEDGLNGVRDGISSDGQGLSEEDGSKINADAKDGNEARRDLVQVQPVLHTQQQQPQGPLVRWERFLPFRSLKVLLVENDDSTRHVVSALLRNCSYEVTAVENGLEAWKILEDLTSHVDLVLTEVVMPYLSGIGLLSKIMNHKTRKNVPVIMMSSNDSMGVVFKSLSKGAVDFLVKPIRKNELKNLWQHIWRKCHSSSGSGSGSESGIRTQKSIRSKSVEGSENSIDSSDEAENGSIGLNTRDGSDNGSGTQGSWSKRTVEVDSPQPMSPWDELADPPDSTCAQVIHSSTEAISANWVPATATREKDEQGNAGMGKDLNIGVAKVPELEGLSVKAVDGIAGSTDTEKMVGNIEVNKETWVDDLKDKDVGHMGAITNICNHRVESMVNEVPKNPSKITNIKVNEPSLELSLKQLRDVGDTGTSVQKHNILRHSDLSAFSRYNAASTANQSPTGKMGSCSPVNNSSEVAKTESMLDLQYNSSSTPNQQSNGSNINDIGSSTNNVLVKPKTLTEKPITKPAVIAHSSLAFQPVEHGHDSSLQPMVSGKPEAGKETVAQARALHQQVQVQHHHHHYHHHHHHIEGNAANYESASGSNNGSNGQNGSSGQDGSGTAVITEGTNMITENGAAEQYASGSGSGSASRTVADLNRSAQREAALNKFRQKRKERCFEKKVRYQSRKRLAEQRPRMRGQFVCQATDKNKSKDTNS